MIRKYLNSRVAICDIAQFKMNDMFLIQAECMGAYIMFEFCMSDEVIDLIPFTANFSEAKNAPKGDAHKIEEYMSTEIRNDPFGKYTGRTLGDIFNAGDTKWIDRCIEQMRNDYIRDRVVYLKDNLKM